MDYVHQRYIDKTLTYGPNYNQLNFQQPSILGIYNTNSKGNGRYIVGNNPKLDGVFKKANPNDIAEFDESIQSWVFTKPYKGMEVINIDINDTDYGQKLLKYDGSKWVSIMDMSGSGGGGSFDYAKVAGRLDETHNFSIKGVVNCTSEEFNGTQDVELKCNKLVLDTSLYKIDGVLNEENGGTGNNYGGASQLTDDEKLIIQLGGGANGTAESDLSIGNRNMIINVSNLNMDKASRGILAVPYGGTGRNTFISGKFLVGDEVNKLEEYQETVGSDQKPVYFKDGNVTVCSNKLNIDIYGNSDSSTKLTSSAGSLSVPIYFKDGKPEVCTSIDIPVHAVSDTAKKLETPRKISLTGDVEGNVNFDGSQDVTIDTTLINSYEAYLQWGAGSKNISVQNNELTPVDIATNPSMTNLFRRMKDTHLDKGVKIEYSSNGGSSWNVYKNSVENKYNLTNLKTDLELRGTNTDRRTINSDRIKITINSAAGVDTNWTGLWCLLKKLHLYIDTNGSKNCKCQVRIKIEDVRSLGSGSISWINERWEDVGTFDISGTAGWDAINFNLKDSKTSTNPEFGGSWCPSKINNTRPVITKLELTFKQNSIDEWTTDSSYSKDQFEAKFTGLHIYSLYGFGTEYNCDRNSDATPIAYQLANKRNFQISGKAIASAKEFDGTQDVNLEVTDISACRLDHNVTLNLTGDIIGSTTTNLSTGECNIIAKYAGSGGMNPTGTIIWFAAKNAPTGYLVCNGQAVSRSTYSALFSVISTIHGSGDGSTTFNIPNLIGKTTWGAESSSVGTVKSPGLPNITGEISASVENYAGSTWGCFYQVGSGATVGDHRYVVNGAGFNASKSNSIYGNSSTVQPPALCLLPCIKY